MYRDLEMQTSALQQHEEINIMPMSNRYSQNEQSSITYQGFRDTYRSDEFQRTDHNLKGIKDLVGSYLMTPAVYEEMQEHPGKPERKQPLK